MGFRFRRSIKILLGVRLNFGKSGISTSIGIRGAHGTVGRSARCSRPCANTAHWVDWTRHFGPPSRMSSGIANLRERYLITTFTYGCGLGATQAARHFGGAV